MQSITPYHEKFNRIAVLLIIIMSVWGASAVLATAFQCQVPHTWDYINNKCFDRVRAIVPLYPLREYLRMIYTTISD